MNTIAVIGAGAAGLAFASTVSRNVKDTTIYVFEQYNRSGKKILASGNGRCNVSNKEMSINHYNTTNQDIEHIITAFDPVAYFNDLGMLTTYVGNLLYPYSNQAVTVKNALMDSLTNVIVKEECKVLEIKREDTQYTIYTTSGIYQAKYVVYACGSCASKLSGEDNLASIKGLKIKTNPLFPSLVQLKTKPVYRQCKGVKIKCRVSLLVNNQIIDTKEGELLFTDYGVSGICIMQLSRHYYQYIDDVVEISIDLLPTYNQQEVTKMLEERQSKYHGKYLTGIFNNKLASVLEVIQNINFKDWRFEVIGTNDYSQAQVMHGGIALSEVDQNLECKQYKNMFIVGEALDVDGDCGGYNLHFAFASGNHVGHSIADRININVKDK